VVVRDEEARTRRVNEQKNEKQVTRMDSLSESRQHIDAGENKPAPSTVSDDQVSNKPRRKLTREERLQRLADSGVDTWEEYRGEK
jgi:hypothetical protein